ncbi:MlrC C-terminal domain-containing protein, partial [Bordetella pertussis]|uniref:MlrC C-terminal domain-containing protein n=1 Tax=Bordetella pertussis TaxID=520 RepID=UPI00366E84BA
TTTNSPPLSLLKAHAQAGKRWHGPARRLPFLIPINGMCTQLEPARGVYALLAELERSEPGIASLSCALGFPAADFPECGPVVWAHGPDRDAVERAVQTLADRIAGLEAQWAPDFLAPDEAIRQARQLAQGARRPVVIADTQDNPGAGGDANTTGMLRALIDADADNAAIGLMCDPQAVTQVLGAGVGRCVRLRLGGRSGVAGDAPCEAEFIVEHQSDGKTRYDGPMMHGMAADLGPTVCLRHRGVRVIVSSNKSQTLDRNLIRLGGIDPEDLAILVVKSSVHFRADFEPIAHAVLIAKAPGPMQADPADLPWTRLAPGMRTRPRGRPFVPARP